MHRTWCTKSYVTRGAQVLSHQDLHTYSTLHYIHAKDLVHKIVCHQRGTSPKSSGPTYLQYITLHYSKVQYITLHYSTLHYSTVHYSTYMQRTCKSSVTRGAQVLSHQNVHTYLTLHYNTEHYIPIHFSIFFNLFNYFKILSVYKSKGKNGKSEIFFEIFFLKMGTSPKSSFFQRLARGLRPNDGVVQRGIQ